MCNEDTYKYDNISRAYTKYIGNELPLGMADNGKRIATEGLQGCLQKKKKKKICAIILQSYTEEALWLSEHKTEERKYIKPVAL